MLVNIQSEGQHGVTFMLEHVSFRGGYLLPEPKQNHDSWDFSQIWRIYISEYHVHEGYEGTMRQLQLSSLVSWKHHPPLLFSKKLNASLIFMVLFSHTCYQRKLLECKFGAPKRHGSVMLTFVPGEHYSQYSDTDSIQKNPQHWSLVIPPHKNSRKWSHKRKHISPRTQILLNQHFLNIFQTDKSISQLMIPSLKLTAKGPEIQWLEDEDQNLLLEPRPIFQKHFAVAFFRKPKLHYHKKRFPILGRSCSKINHQKHPPRHPTSLKIHLPFLQNSSQFPHENIQTSTCIRRPNMIMPAIAKPNHVGTSTFDRQTFEAWKQISWGQDVIVNSKWQCVQIPGVLHLLFLVVFDLMMWLKRDISSQGGQTW